MTSLLMIFDRYFLLVLGTLSKALSTTKQLGTDNFLVGKKPNYQWDLNQLPLEENACSLPQSF